MMKNYGKKYETKKEERKNKEGSIIVDAIYKDETLWLTQKGMSKVFDVGIPTISKQLNNIFNVEELDKNSVVSKMEITALKKNQLSRNSRIL
ncbi:MAG: hypothetical protein RSB77_06370 [Bacilli bacterium]